MMHRSISRHSSVGALATLAIVVATSPAAAATAQFYGKFWIVPQAIAGNASRPPKAVPDATFTASHLSFWLNVPLPGYPNIPSLNNTVSALLNSADQVRKLVFSGLVNSTIGAVVGPNTPTTDSNASTYGTYGACMEFSGHIMLTTGQVLLMTHDDGVALWVDGEAQSGLSSGAASVVAQGVSFTGATGIHHIRLNYCNVYGPGILSFSPPM